MRNWMGRRGFTLVELLVVIGIVAVLIGVLLPVIGRARKQANSVKCLANLRAIVQGFVLYSTNNNGYIIPSYNLPFTAAPYDSDNYNGGPTQPMDGWAPILDRDKIAPSAGERSTSTIFYCPDTYDVDGMKNGQTSVEMSVAAGAQRGWTDWPLRFSQSGGDSVPKESVTIPDQGFNKIIRVGYWINAYNPVGSVPTAAYSSVDLYYTTSVGFGSKAYGYLNAHKISGVRRPSQVIAVADGLYMGRQTVNGVGMTNSRIGYRHPGPGGKIAVANAGFADGHAEAIPATEFPCAFAKTSSYAANGSTMTLERQKSINFGLHTVYSNVDTAWTIFNTANAGAN